MDTPGPSSGQETAGHVTDHVTSEMELRDHVTCQIDRTECRTVLDLYRVMVGSCLERHFAVVYLPTTSNRSLSCVFLVTCYLNVTF